MTSTKDTPVLDPDEVLYIWDNGEDYENHRIEFVTSKCDKHLMTTMLNALSAAWKYGGVIAHIRCGEQTWFRPSHRLPLGEFLAQFVYCRRYYGSTHIRQLNALPDEFLRAVTTEAERDSIQFDTPEFLQICRADPEDG